MDYVSCTQTSVLLNDNVHHFARKQLPLYHSENLDFSSPLRGFPRGFSGKELTCQSKRHGFSSWVGKILWRRKWQPTLVFLPGKSHGASWPTVYGVAKSLTQRSDWACMHSPLNTAPNTIYLLVASAWYIFRILYLAFATGIFGFHPRNWLFSLLASSKAQAIVWYLCDIALGKKSSLFILTLLVFVWITRGNLSFHIHTVVKENLVFVLNLWCFPMLRTVMFLIILPPCKLVSPCKRNRGLYYNNSKWNIYHVCIGSLGSHGETKENTPHTGTALQVRNPELV